MSHTHPHEAHHVKKGGHIMLKGRPTKIVDVKTSKTGKHGHAKCNMTGVCVLNGRKYNEVHPGHIVLRAFNPLKTQYEVIDVDQEEGLVICINEEGAEVKIPLDTEIDVHNEIPDAFASIEEGKVLQVEVIEAPVDLDDKGEKVELQSTIIAHKYVNEE